MQFAISSAAGYIAMLDEPNVRFKCFALQKLNEVVDYFWPQISDEVAKIEALYEDKTFTSRKWAAIVASKIYYHLGVYEDAIMYVLGAEDLFDVSDNSLYTSTMTAKCLDHYIMLRSQNADVDPRLEAVANKMIDRCFGDKQYRQAVGIALEAKRLDVLEKAIMTSSDVPGILSYSMRIVLDLVQNRQYRNELLRLLIKLYAELPQPDFINTCQCLIYLEDPQSVADILEKLVKESPVCVLTAYQIAFDLYESASQQYIAKILQSIRHRAPIPILAADTQSGTTTVNEPASTDTIQSGISRLGIDGSQAEKQERGDAMDTDDDGGQHELTLRTNPLTQEAEPSSAIIRTHDQLSDVERRMQECLEKLVKILGGSETVKLHMQFLIKNNNTDMLILKNIKESVRNNISHTATVITNGFMHFGTTCDSFLRDNLEWVSRATNWAKFTAVGSLGAIHKGHETDAMRLLESYLPKEGAAAATSGYMEGGGLYALGLIHANHGANVVNYLNNQLRAATQENVKHGACLGLGLAAMGSHRTDVYDQLRNSLFSDDAVVGEAAGLAMGLVMLGSNSTSAVQDMVAYAQETQHEKILRGLSVGLALIMYGRLEEAESLIESLCRDKDPILRRSGVYTIAMAYCGTGKNDAIRRLLHFAVSDVNDDVKRAAVTCLGFLLFRTPEQCPKLVALLCESFNPHVRYGAAIALGIACAGTANREAVGLLDPMLNDSVNYVRQGAVMALSFVLIQQNEVGCSKVKEFRQTLTKMINDKHEDNVAKMGAVIAQGILDAGGRNVTISLLSRNGHMNMTSVVGVLVFLQYWFWFPLAHFLSLAFTPTCLIGLNADLQMPKIEFRSNARPSLFAYPPSVEEKKDKGAEKVETAVLSVTAKAKKKEKQKQDEKVAGDSTSSDKKGSEKKAEKGPEGDVVKMEVDPKESKPEPEPNVQLLQNPARVVKVQLKYLVMPEGARYWPLKNLTQGGIILMSDKLSDQPVELIDPIEASGEAKAADEAEPEPPEPFEWTDETAST